MDSLSNGVRDLRFSGRYEEARQAARRLVALVRDDPEIPAWLREDAACDLRALERIVSLPSPSREELARAHRLQAVLMDDLSAGRYAAMAASARRQVEVFRRILGADDFDTGIALDNLAAALIYQGDLREAEKYCREALQAVRRARSGDHPEILQILNNMAALFNRRGDYAAAEPFFREIVSVQRRLIPSDNKETALYLRNLARCRANQGNISEARSNLRDAVQVYRGLPGCEREVAQCMTFLGTISLRIQDYPSAVALLEQALAIQERTLGPDHPDAGETLFALGQAWCDRTDQRDPERAEQFYLRALRIKQAKFGDLHWETANVLHRLGALRASRGHLVEGDSLLEAARRAYSSSLGEGHPYVALSLREMARVELTRAGPGDLQAAEARALRAAEIYELARRRAGLGLDRATFQRSPYAELAAARLALGRNKEAWESAERMQGRALFDLLAVTKRRPLSQEETAREDSLREQLSKLERQASVLRKALRSDSSEKTVSQFEETRRRLLAAEAVWKRTEQEIALKYPAAEGRGYPLERIQRSLAPETALIGWLDFKTCEGKIRSWGYVLRSQGPVRWARLESDSILTREDVRAWRGLLASPASSAEQWRAGNRRLWAERIQPLEQWMAGARRLVVIPSGAMVGIPLEDLEDAQGRCLNDVYEISYTPSATLYAWLKEQPPALGTEAEPIGRGAALLVGDPVFRAAATAPEGNRPSPAGRKSEPSPPSRESEPSPPPRKAEPYPATSIQRGVALTRSWDQDDQRTGDLRQLPWTRAEVEGVARGCGWPHFRGDTCA